MQDGSLMSSIVLHYLKCSLRLTYIEPCIFYVIEYNIDYEIHKLVGDRCRDGITDVLREDNEIQLEKSIFATIFLEYTRLRYCVTLLNSMSNIVSV